jgi:hypothetical protein
MRFVDSRIISGERVMTRPRTDDLVVESWRTEPRLSHLQALEVDESSYPDAPAWWKDIVFATLLAIVLWLSAAALFW